MYLGKGTKAKTELKKGITRGKQSGHGDRWYQQREMIISGVHAKEKDTKEAALTKGEAIGFWWPIDYWERELKMLNLNWN